MHAILALGASHLHSRTDLDLEQTVERHRNQAMRGLLECQCDGEISAASVASREIRLNAQLAAAYVLTFTATYMGDPVSRFMVLVRGCTSLTGEIIRCNFTSPLFPQGQGPTSSDTHVDAMRDRLTGAPLLECAEQIDMAKHSLQSAAIHLTFTPVEMEFFTLLQITLESVNNPIECMLPSQPTLHSEVLTYHAAYGSFLSLWELFSTMPTEDFAHFTDPTNVTGLVLQAHFLALELLIRPWRNRECLERHDNHDRDTPGAISSCSFSMDQAAVKLMEWPLAFIEASRQDFGRA